MEKSYAIQAGRDLRIIVDSQKVKDEETTLLSRDIAKAIEEQLTYPGQIRVTVTASGIDRMLPMMTFAMPATLTGQASMLLDGRLP